MGEGVENFSVDDFLKKKKKKKGRGGGGRRGGEGSPCVDDFVG